MAIAAPQAATALEGLEADWTDCIERTARGDGQALTRLYDGTRRLVYGLALRILGNIAEAEEVTLDVYAQIWRAAGSFDAGRGSALAWILMLTRSRSVDRRRSSIVRRGREEPLETAAEIPAGSLSPEQSIALLEKQQRVRAALCSLPREQQEALELAFFSGLTHAELAAHLGEPLGTVKTRVRLGMSKLRDALGAI